ncbi:MAG: lysylphosphatidylglycerol synthase domain-containing protein [Actinomycetota bacterium]
MQNSGKSSKRIAWAVGAVALALSLAFIAKAVDGAILERTWRAAAGQPFGILLALGAYAAAFLIRSVVWARLLPGLSLGHALAAIHVSLGGNHVLPLRLGEALRVTSVVRRTEVSLGAATASTVMLRASDIFAVVGLAALLGPQVVDGLVGGGGRLLLIPAAALWVGGLWWLRRLEVSRTLSLGRSMPLIGLAATTAWVLESVMLWQAAHWAGLDVGFADAVLVTAVTIVAQVVAIAPAGLGTYEAAATAAFIALGFDAAPALAAALTAHAVKTAYSLIAGGVALFLPSPSALGRLRLPPPGGPPEGPRRNAARRVEDPEPKAGRRPEGQPVVLFMPAHNEQDAVASMVSRTPVEVWGHPVRCLVIDDGSTDATAKRARRAGAEVIDLPGNRGLGYAVRCGLAESLERNACAVAFCDADGEYAPEELAGMVEPILRGSADYVVGTRLRGRITRMLPHRRLGNVMLTRLLSFVARRQISDGQSGYRAFSRAAAADAEVVHDFNYAQVLTLDLLAKGYRYAEVPITYGFRESGKSFVRLSVYLRRVLPAIHLELNS